MRHNLLFILTLPIVSLGQGFVITQTHYIDNIDYNLENYIDACYNKDHLGFIATTPDSVHVYKITNGKLSWVTIKSHPNPSGFEIQSTQITDKYFTEYHYTDNLLLYNLKGKLKKKKKVVRKKHISIEYSFQDDDYLYFINYYNRNTHKKSPNHDLVGLYKWSKKSKKIIKTTKIDIGTEILLAPFNHQLISFNQNIFVICDRIGHKLITLNKDFEIMDTVYLNKKEGDLNWNKFKKTFGDSSILYYMHKPKDVMFHFSNSDNVNKIRTINKIMFLNDSIMCVSYKKGVHPNYTFFMELFNINSRKKIHSKEIPKTGSFYSPLTWTTRIYPNTDGQFLTISSSKIDGELKYKVIVSEYSENRLLDTNELKLYDILDYNFARHKVGNFSGIILSDEYYCKGCFGSYGSGENVLVIKSFDEINKENLNIKYESIKKLFHVNGEIGFVERDTYNKLKALLHPNILYPIDSLE